MNDQVTQMIQLAHQKLKNAYAPYSNFQVACCLRTSNNKLYTGVNVENASFGMTVCAEAAAICQMVQDGEQQIEELVVLAGTDTFCAPCGACRQRILEFSKPDTLIHISHQKAVFETVTISELMPMAFRFKPNEQDNT